MNINNFMKKFSNSYNEASLLNSIKTRENILVLDEGRHSIFYEKNIYPIAVKEDYNYLINLIQNTQFWQQEDTGAFIKVQQLLTPAPVMEMLWC